MNRFLVRLLQFSLQALLLWRMEQHGISNNELDYGKLRFHLSRSLNHHHQPFHNLKVFEVFLGRMRPSLRFSAEKVIRSHFDVLRMDPILN